MVGKDATFRWVPAHVGPWERSQSQSRAGPGWGGGRGRMCKSYLVSLESGVS